MSPSTEMLNRRLPEAGETALTFACMRGDPDVAVALLQRKDCSVELLSTPNVFNETPLWLACEHNLPEAALALLDLHPEALARGHILRPGKPLL